MSSSGLRDTPPMIAVCAKWVDLHPEIDPLTGSVTTDDRRRGFSAADRAALEVGLRLAEERSTTVTLLSSASSGADAALRELAACGASRIVRIDTDADTTSANVGRELADAVLGACVGAELVLTGDHSLDRGSGSVPAFLAHHLGWSQALGLIEVGSGDPLAVVRRLDGGRREHLRVEGPAVLSVEGSVARLRRASMPQVLAARRIEIDVRHGDAVTPDLHVGPTSPVRPRARALPAPHGDRALSRIVELTGALVERTPPRRVEADGIGAAQEIVAQLRAWGYIE